MDHDGRPVGISVGGDVLRTQCQQSVGAAGVDVRGIVLRRHDGDLIDHPLQRFRDDRSLGGRHARLETEPAPPVLVPIAQRAVSLELHRLLVSRLDFTGRRDDGS